MRRLRKLLRLSGVERWLLMKATLLLGVVRVGLWLLPFATVRRLLDKLTETPVRVRNRERSRNDVVWAVETAGRCVPPASTCLSQALTAQVMLLRRGHPAVLHIGVVKEEGGFLAHAWVESDSEVMIGGHGLDRYTPLTVLEGSSR